jgi:hypothetical protein
MTHRKLIATRSGSRACSRSEHQRRRHAFGLPAFKQARR